MQQMSALKVSTSSQYNFLVSIRKKYYNHLIIGNLNINSLPNKFEDLKILVKGKVDIIVITESKLDHIFPGSSFRINGYNKPFRKDRNRNGGEIFVFIRDDIPCKELQIIFFNEFEVLFVEINLSHSKWLFVACYHPPNQNDDLIFRKLSNQIDFYSKTYDNFFIVGDFNCQETEPMLSEFLNMHSAKNIVKEETCFKSIENPSCIDLFLTNKPNLFFNTSTINTGYSDCHKMVVTVLRKTFQRAQPKVVSYRNYKNFDNEFFKSPLQNALNEISRPDYIKFEEVYLETLNKHALVKQKTIRGNHAPHMTQGPTEAIVRRSELESELS